MYLAFLDEFGHIGPFISRTHSQYNHSPVFGLAGYIMPHSNARDFATWFYKQKYWLFESEINDSTRHPATWEKKGTDIFTSKNVIKYRSIKGAIFKILNKIYKLDGRVFYCGRQKYLPPHKSKPTGLYTTVLAHSIRQLDKRFCDEQEMFLMILDQHSDRAHLLATAAKTMFGQEAARCLIEPPFQVESHLYQTIQAADWIATIIGRLMAYRVEPNEYSDWKWAESYYGQRIDKIATHSSLWRPKATH